MPPMFNISTVVTAVAVCGFAIAGVVVVYQKNTSDSYVINTSIPNPEVPVNQSEVGKIAQQKAVSAVPPSEVTRSVMQTASSTSIPTSNSVAIPGADTVDDAAYFGTENVTESVVAEVDKVAIPVYTKGTVLSAMEAYRDASDFTFLGTSYPGLGFFVDTIAGRHAAGGYYWILYVDDQRSSLGASSAVVGPGDRLEWRYEKNPY